jgi:hypothetical protein
MCLDGSPAGIYFSKGWGDGINKTIVHFDGGGWCTGSTPQEVLNDCYLRSFTDKGSTDPNVTNEYTDVNQHPDYHFSGAWDDDINFYNWNRFFIIYCDGTGHQGYIEKPQLVKGKLLYFRGHFNVAAHFSFIFSLLPPELTDTFVVNGCSAGGLATYTWLETI